MDSTLPQPVAPPALPGRDLRPAPPATPPPFPAAADDPSRQRILAAARTRFFAQGFHTITMSDLAGELGMSKKTLYRHFPTKEALLDAVLDQFASEAGALLEAVRQTPGLTTTEQLGRILEGVARHLAPIQPVFLVSLRRFAPAQWDRLEALRRRNLERHLLPMLQTGQARGEIQPHIPPAFVVEVLLRTLQEILQPESLERLAVPPAQAVAQVLDILFHGIAVPAPALPPRA